MCLAIVDEDILRYVRVKKKAYVRLVTNFGNLNLELHSDMVIWCLLANVILIFLHLFVCSPVLIGHKWVSPICSSVLYELLIRKQNGVEEPKLVCTD